MRHYKTVIKYKNEEVGTLNPLDITIETEHVSICQGLGNPIIGRIISSRKHSIDSNKVKFCKGFTPSLDDRFDIVTDMIDLPTGIKMSRKKRIKKKYKKKYGSTIILNNCIVNRQIYIAFD
jgi:RNAse (barnase) inhibitor barstar